VVGGRVGLLRRLRRSSLVTCHCSQKRWSVISSLFRAHSRVSWPLCLGVQFDPDVFSLVPGQIAGGPSQPGQAARRFVSRSQPINHKLQSPTHRVRGFGRFTTSPRRRGGD